MADRNDTSSRSRFAWLLGSVVLALAVAAGGYYLYLRFFAGNFHTVVPGQVYRSAQPSDSQLRRWTQRYGLRTVINLRGESSRDFWPAEVALAEQLGLRHVNLKLSAMRLPPRPLLLALADALETAERPMLIHCAHGADRTGLASVMAAMAVGGQPYDAAREQLSARYLHLADDDDGIGAVAGLYESACAAHGRPTGGWREFRRWLDEEYWPYYYRVEIVAPRELSARPGERLTVEVTVVNRSGETLPAADAARQFNLAVFTGSSAADSPDRELGPRTPLGRRDLPPGQSVAVTQTIVVPRDLPVGDVTIHFDVVEEHRTWFARQGSPVPGCTLHVR
ncbi:MAG TPA: tyrosine-protein phosphatase [Phycisphaerae bacterium]|nr:tyrosine-protein phosphatase [Phycisphaerae bacterium]